MEISRGIFSGLYNNGFLIIYSTPPNSRGTGYGEVRMREQVLAALKHNGSRLDAACYTQAASYTQAAKLLQELLQDGYVSREEARERGEPTFYTGKVCRAGHRARWSTRSGRCLECRQAVGSINIQDARLAAREAGEPTFDTGRPCRRGHSAPRDTVSGRCLECYPMTGGDPGWVQSSRRAAEAAGEPTFDTGRPCRNGHRAPRDTVSGRCLACYPRRLSVRVYVANEAQAEKVKKYAKKLLTG